MLTHTPQAKNGGQIWKWNVYVTEEQYLYLYMYFHSTCLNFRTFITVILEEIPYYSSERTFLTSTTSGLLFKQFFKESQIMVVDHRDFLFSYSLSASWNPRHSDCDSNIVLRYTLIRPDTYLSTKVDYKLYIAPILSRTLWELLYLKTNLP